MNTTQNRLKNAETRLGNALDRLERALAASTASTQSTARGAPADPALADELSRLQSENAQLKGLVGQAVGRLDATIDKFKAQDAANAAKAQ